MKRKLEVVYGKLVEAIRLPSSCNGNPRWDLSFIYDDDEKRLNGFTVTDAMCAYKIHDDASGRWYRIKYHYTAKGNVMINYLDEVKRLYIASGYYWLHTIYVDASQYAYNPAESIALACIEQKRGLIWDVNSLSDEDIEMYDDADDWMYADLTPYGYGCYYVCIEHLREVDEDE